MQNQIPKTMFQHKYPISPIKHDDYSLFVFRCDLEQNFLWQKKMYPNMNSHLQSITQRISANKSPFGKLLDGTSI